MPAAWKTIRVFISSTFCDMHAERDYLVRFVFPELRERCRSLRVLLQDMDLRWGITEDDVRQGRTLEVCLEEIDACRPYFLGLLGHRYGWVPPGEGRSITALEISHAVLHGHVPGLVTNLEAIIHGEFKGGPLSELEQSALVEGYQFDPFKNHYRLKPDIPARQSDIIREVFRKLLAYQRDRSFFFFRTEELSRALAGDRIDEFFDPKHQPRLEALKQELVRAKLPHYEYGRLEDMGRIVAEVLWSRIREEAGRVPKPSVAEDEFHDRFIQDRTRIFVGRQKALSELESFAESSDPPNTMVVLGAPGRGKSALMARFARNQAEAHPQRLVLVHFVGASSASAGFRDALSHLGAQLIQKLGIEEHLPEELEELTALVPRLLTDEARTSKVVVIIDGFNQFDRFDRSLAYKWLPRVFGTGARFAFSTTPGPELEVFRQTSPVVRELILPQLNQGEIEALVHGYLSEIRRDFPNEEVRATFLARVDQGNPLHITAALEELRMVGVFEDLPAWTARLPRRIDDLLAQVLARLERDFSSHPNLVRDFMVLLVLAREPLAATAIQTILRGHVKVRQEAGEPDRLPDLVWARLYRAFGGFLFVRRGQVDFFHGQMREAAAGRYLNRPEDMVEGHRVMAGFCVSWPEMIDPVARSHGLRYLLFHTVKAREWSAAEKLLADGQYLAQARRSGRRPALSLVEVHPENPGQVSFLIESALFSKSEAARGEAIEALVDLELPDGLIRSLGAESDLTRMGAVEGLLKIFKRRLDRGDEAGAWAVVDRVRAGITGRLGLPRIRRLNGLIGLFTAILVDCADDAGQLNLLAEQARMTARSVLPFRRHKRAWLRTWQRWVVRALLLLIRPGTALAMTALRHSLSAVNLTTARDYFKKSRSEREAVRAYYPYLEPRPTDLGILAGLVGANCTNRDPFHYNLILATTAIQGLVQPGPMIEILRETAARDDTLAQYEAFRGLAYALTLRREEGLEVNLEWDALLADWFEQFYQRPDRRLHFPGSTIKGRSLAVYVGDYWAAHDRPEAQTFDRQLRQAVGEKDYDRLGDLIEALGFVGQHGHQAFVFQRLKIAFRGCDPPRGVRPVLLEALARIYFHRPRDVAVWLEENPEFVIGVDEVAGYPLAEAGGWRGSVDRTLIRVLLSLPEMRAVLFRILDQMPRARSLGAFLAAAARELPAILY